MMAVTTGGPSGRASSAGKLLAAAPTKKGRGLQDQLSYPDVGRSGAPITPSAALFGHLLAEVLQELPATTTPPSGITLHRCHLRFGDPPEPRQRSEVRPRVQKRQGIPFQRHGPRPAQSPESGQKPTLALLTARPRADPGDLQAVAPHAALSRASPRATAGRLDGRPRGGTR